MGPSRLARGGPLDKWLAPTPAGFGRLPRDYGASHWRLGNVAWPLLRSRDPVSRTRKLFIVVPASTRDARGRAHRPGLEPDVVLAKLARRR